MITWASREITMLKADVGPLTPPLSRVPCLLSLYLPPFHLLPYEMTTYHPAPPPYSHPFLLSAPSVPQLDPIIHNPVGLSINMTNGARENWEGETKSCVKYLRIKRLLNKWHRREQSMFVQTAEARSTSMYLKMSAMLTQDCWYACNAVTYLYMAWANAYIWEQQFTVDMKLVQGFPFTGFGSITGNHLISCCCKILDLNAIFLYTENKSDQTKANGFFLL